MNLEHIARTECPVCGEKQVVGETRDHQHTNGQWNESRTFACQHKVAYFPNVGQIQNVQACTRDPLIKRREVAETEFKKRLVKFILDEKSDVSEEFKDRIIRWINKGY